MSARPGSVRSRVGRLEAARRQRASRGAACAVCGGDGYPATFVRTGEGAAPQRVGATGCSGCGRVRVGAVVVLPGGGEGKSEWTGADEEAAA